MKGARRMYMFISRRRAHPGVLPSEHFIVALIPVVAYVVVREKRLPSLRLVGVVFVGSQFPDLIDKPLAHQFGLLPSGRVFMHSLPIAVPFVLLVALYAWKTDRRRLGVAFAFGHLSHLLADNYEPLLRPNPQISPDLLWPFVEPVQRPVVPYWAGTGGINVTLWTLFSVVLLSILGYVMLVDVREHLTT